MRPPPAQRLLTPMAEWPDLDRRLWAAAFVKRGPLDAPRYGAGLKPKSIYFAERSYSRWLGVLAEAAVLDPLAPPVARATPEHLDLFVRALRDTDNVDNTIAARLWGLRQALQIMQPGAYVGWLTSPGGVSINSLLRAVRRHRFVPDSLELFEWGFELIAAAAACADPRARRTGHRNGVLIAILASRAPRLRTLAGMRLGQHVQRHAERYHLTFEDEDLKAGKPLAYDLPQRLTAAIDRYLEVERIELLEGRTHDFFWVGRGGEKLSERGIEAVIFRGSARRFDEAFRPQRCRHALATTWAKRDPVHLAAVPAVLGNTGPVAEKYYNLAKQTDAARLTNASLEEDREETRALAAKLFGDGR